MIRVQAVVPTENDRLLVTFTNGERRRFDMRPYLHDPVFKPLERPAFFALARVRYGTEVWPGEIDIAPETHYDRSVPLDDTRETTATA